MVFIRSAGRSDRSFRVTFNENNSTRVVYYFDFDSSSGREKKFFTRENLDEGEENMQRSFFQSTNVTRKR